MQNMENRLIFAFNFEVELSTGYFGSAGLGTELLVEVLL